MLLLLLMIYSYREQVKKKKHFIFLHDHLPFFLGEIVENFSRKSCMKQKICFFFFTLSVHVSSVSVIYMETGCLENHT